MKIDLVTIFPGILDGPFRESMIKKAVDQGLIEITLVDLRNYTRDRHRQVDDTPYGGGPGMILKPEPLFEAVEDLKKEGDPVNSRVILMTPQGRPLTQQIAAEFSKEKHLILICGRYEGVDERVREALVDDEISIGDYVLTGGELAAAVVVDAVVRLIPGFLAEGSAENESFTDNLLEHPHYTRPAVYRGMQVPPVLLSGNHGEIEKWRRQQALDRTRQRRPEMLLKADMSPEESRIYLKDKQHEKVD